MELQRNSSTTLTRQIYQALRSQISSGCLHQGERLPSTRELARQLAVSRNTVNEAYEMLLAEGFAESRPGAPTRVAGGLLPDGETRNVKAMEGADPPIKAQAAAEKIRWKADFRTGQPDLRCFPRRPWLQLMRQAAEEMPPEYWGYSDLEGLPELRTEISSWLFRSRGMTASPENIFITAGATGALHVLAELLAGRGTRIIIEDPCHTGMLRVLQARGLEAVPVPVDGHGLQTDLLESANACAVYVTPSHQFPLGGVLPASRRAALIRYARENSLYIIEDDYDSEFRYGGPPISPLYTMDQERVIYVGTFSKILYPALRIGYAVLPPVLHREWRFLRRHTDVQNPVFEQAALAAFLKSRKLDRHVRQMGKLYGQRRKCLLEALETAFGDRCRTVGDAAGLHLSVEIAGLGLEREMSRRCREAEINLALVEEHAIRKGAYSGHLLLGYGHLNEDEIVRGVGLLRDLFFSRN